MQHISKLAPETREVEYNTGQPPSKTLTSQTISEQLYTPAWQIKAASAAAGGCKACGARPGQAGYLRRDVPPGDKDFGKLVKCPTCWESAQAQKIHGASQLEGVLLSKAFCDYTVMDGNRGGYEAAVKFAQGPSGWLVLHGPHGVGKTHLAAAIGNCLVADQIGVVYYTLAGLMDMLRNAVGKGDLDSAFNSAIRVPVLIVDELSNLNETDWSMERARELFDARYRAMAERGTVFVSNTRPMITGGEWDYLYSRMLDYRNTIVEIGGGDCRPLGLS